MAHEVKFHGYAAHGPEGELKPYEWQPRPLGDDDVQLTITHSGICASDIHQKENGWKNSKYPMVPGHEIIGLVEEVGKHVKDFKKGQRVGVGTQVLSCLKCDTCHHGDEQYCDHAVQTYNAKYPDGTIAFGGYADHIRVHQRFVFAIPDNLSSEGAAPLLCAGITTYTPFKVHNIKAGQKIGVLGIGGLGHLGLKWGKALGCHVTAISHNDKKREEAKKLGADDFISLEDAAAVKKARRTLDFILSTGNAKGMKWDGPTSLLKIDGVFCVVGVPEEDLIIPPFLLIGSRISFAGSMVGGCQITKEMLELAGKHKIEADVQLFPMEKVNEAIQGVKDGKPRFRYVLTNPTHKH